MPDYTLELADFNCKLKVYYLCKNGKRLLDEFEKMLKNDGNLSRQVPKLYAYLESIANTPNLPIKLPNEICNHIIDSEIDCLYEIKSKNLRLYFLYNPAKNIIITIGGKKTTQKIDIAKFKAIAKDFIELS